MNERIGKFLACLIIAPVACLIMIVSGFLMLLLPIVALFKPDIVVFGGKGK